MSLAAALVAEASSLRDAAADCAGIAAGPDFVYHPLEYGWAAHSSYLSRWPGTPLRAVFVGMNPGPFGMVQTAVPFGEVAVVRGWLGIDSGVTPPARQHPARPVEGFACSRSEVSGRRLWGYFRDRFGTSDAFFRECLVLNYCPLAFLADTGRNLTPDRFPASRTAALFAACDRFLRQACVLLEPEFVVGVGRFAADRCRAALAGAGKWKVTTVLHPSPASPAANRGWAGAAEASLVAEGVFPAGPIAS